MDINENSDFGQWSRSSEDSLRTKYPLHRACRDGDIDTLSLQLISGQNLLTEDEFYGWTPAHWAAYFGQLACLRRVMQVLNVEPSSSRYQQTPAHLAAFAGHPHCLQWLLKSGSNPHTNDYLGETPAHKAARTGSMECISLLAADNVDLSMLTNSGMTPSTLAARCGYPDCALYIQRAAEQQQLKRNGVIGDVILPVIHGNTVLPGQKPDRCVITQGLNGGRLPNSIDTHHFVNPDDQTMDMDMEHNTSPTRGGCNNAIIYGLNTEYQAPNHQTNGYSNCTNTFPTDTPLVTGFRQTCNGFASTALQKDVLLSDDVARNLASVAGRKRGREEVEGSLENEELKRMRCLESGLSLAAGQCISASATTNQIMTERMDEMPLSTTEVTHTARAPLVTGALNSALLPIATDKPVNLCSHNFLCSHKYKNSPCI